MRKNSFLIVLLAASLFYLAPYALADWSAVKRLTWNIGWSGAPANAIDAGDTVHVVWYDETPGNFEIYYNKSEDGGAIWSAAKRLTWTPGFSYVPTMAIDSNEDLHVVWYDNTPGNSELYHKRSTDGGANWSAAQRITWMSGGSSRPAIAIDSSDTIHVVWEDTTPGNAEIYYKRSTDGGANWSVPIRLTGTSGNSFTAALAIDSSDTIHVLWQDNSTGNAEIYYRRGADGGTSWSATQRLTWNSGNSYSPSLGLDSGGIIHIVWEDSTPGNYEVYYKRSLDGGITWSAAQRITWTSNSSLEPAMAIDTSGSIRVVWGDDTPGNYEVYYKTSTDGGTTWGAAQRLTWNSGESDDPALAIDSSGMIHVVWQDFTSGNQEIYYKKGN